MPVYLLDDTQLSVIRRVMTRLNDPYTLKTGEKFDLGRMLEAVVLTIREADIQEKER